MHWLLVAYLVGAAVYAAPIAWSAVSGWREWAPWMWALNIVAILLWFVMLPLAALSFVLVRNLPLDTEASETRKVTHSAGR